MIDAWRITLPHSTAREPGQGPLWIRHCLNSEEEECAMGKSRRSKSGTQLTCRLEIATVRHLQRTRARCVKRRRGVCQRSDGKFIMGIPAKDVGASYK